MLFTGVFEPAIDSKGRIAIPAEVRAELESDDDGSTFFLMLSPDRTLRLYQERKFERLVRQIDEAIVNDPAVQEFIQVVFPLAKKLPLDSAGRVRIPDNMLELAGLKDSEIVLLGMRDHMEIKHRAEWRAQLDEKLKKHGDIFQRFASYGRPGASLDDTGEKTNGRAKDPDGK